MFAAVAEPFPSRRRLQDIVNGITTHSGPPVRRPVSNSPNHFSNQPLTGGNQLRAASRCARNSLKVSKAFVRLLRHPTTASAPPQPRTCRMQRGPLPTASGRCPVESAASALAHCGRNERTRLPRTAPTPPAPCAAQVRFKISTPAHAKDLQVHGVRMLRNECVHLPPPP
ncbi:hypothetical protein B0H13DRAFT_350974 [Mycena leptocephala]|nr:hypothetical protein B0H13DRAFT_350974 [Mycena leptocephala]